MLQDIVDYLQEFGAWGLFIHSFIDAVIFPIPALFTQISLSLLSPSSALWLATVGFAACLLGTPFGYMIGRFAGTAFLHRILKKSWIDSASRMFQKNGEAAILIGAFTPIPFKVFTILSGFLNFSLWKLIVYAFLGRAVKFYAVGALFYVFGRAAEGMVHTYLTYILLGIGVLVALGWIVKNRIQKRKARIPERDTAKEEV